MEGEGPGNRLKAVAAGGTVEAGYPAAAKRAEVLGFKGTALRQRRLLTLGG